MEKPVESRLLALASELLIDIVEHIESKHDLGSLALTCSRLQEIAEPALYRSLLIRQGIEADRLFDTLRRRPIRGSFIRDLYVPYSYSSRQGIGILNHLLRRMGNLRNLNIESPCCNDRQPEDFESKGLIDYADYFVFASSMTLGPDPRVRIPLQSFTLHSHNEGSPNRNAFKMGKNAVIFLHPTLRNLTISCLDIGDDVEAFLSGNKAPTSLKSLTFDECNITVKGLASVLSVPKALERLTLGERMHHYHHASVPLGRSPEDLFQALALQKDSLLYLKHVGGHTTISGRATGLSMGRFPLLKEMQFAAHSIFTCILAESALLSPPAIHPELHLRIIWSYILTSDSLVPSVQKWLSQGIHHLDYVLDIGLTGPILPNCTFLNEWKGEQGRKTWGNIVSFMNSQQQTKDAMSGRRFKVFILDKHNYIPPYMYGEPKPIESNFFDSTSQVAKSVPPDVGGSSAFTELVFRSPYV